MNRDSKKSKYLIGVIIVILVSLNVTRVGFTFIGKTTVKPVIIENIDNEESDFLNTVGTLNESNYIISGETGRVGKPKTVCLSNNDIVILWLEDYSLLCIAKYNTDLNKTINPLILVNGSLLTSDEFELSQPNLLVDSSDNLHLFWYIMGFGDPQTGDIYYLKMNVNFEVIVQPKILHTYTHSGYGSSCFVTIFKSLFIVEEDIIHLLVADNTYYLMDNEGDIQTTTSIPETIGEVEELVLDRYGDAIIICENKDTERISSIKYDIEETTLTEVTRYLLFETTDKVIYFYHLLRVDNKLYFYWHWQDNPTDTHYYESYFINLDGSKGEPSTLNEYFYTGITSYMNSTHTASIKITYVFYTEAAIYFSLFNTLQNQNYTENKLLIRFIRNESIFWGPSIHGPKIMPDKDFNFILTWYVNDGNNGFQIFLWKCTLDGTTNQPLVIVAPEQGKITVSVPIFTHPGLAVFIAMITIVAIPKLLKQKKKSK